MSDKEEKIVETRGVKRDKKGRIRFRHLEASKSGKKSESDSNEN